MARTWLPQLHEWLQQHHGVVTVSTLEAITGSRHAAYQLIEHGELETVMPGVYRSCHWPCGRNQLMTAACLRNPSALVAFTTAARVWKFRKIGRPKDIHVLVPHGSSPRLPGVVVHRCRRIDAVDIVERDDGIRLTSPTRTLFDCADMIGAIVATSVLEQLMTLPGLST